MKKYTGNKNSISGLMALLVFGIFAVCVLLVLLQGASTYQRIQERGQAAFEHRTAMQFLSTRIHQADGAVTMASFGNGEALLFEETIDGEEYVTWIYCHDGWLREYFGLAGEELILDFGEPILEANYLTMVLEDGLLWILLEDADGNDHELQIYLRSGGREVNYEE